MFTFFNILEKDAKKGPVSRQNLSNEIVNLRPCMPAGIRYGKIKKAI